MTEINVEEIMREIREEIAQKGYTDEPLSFQDVEAPKENKYEYHIDEYMKIVNEINSDSNVQWYRHLQQGGLKGLIKKVIRRMVAFIIAPMSDEQNLFNAQVARGFNQISGYITEQDKSLDSCREEIKGLEKKVAQLEQQLASVHV